MRTILGVILILIPISVSTSALERPYKELKVTEKVENIEYKSVHFEESFFIKQQFNESSGKHYKTNGKLQESSKGALGIAQFMPKTWNWLKKKSLLPKHFDIKDKEHQIEAQKRYMDYLYEYNYGVKGWNKRELAIAAYNCGPGRVSREIKKLGKSWKTGLPEETKNYLLKHK